MHAPFNSLLHESFLYFLILHEIVESPNEFVMTELVMQQLAAPAFAN